MQRRSQSSNPPVRSPAQGGFTLVELALGASVLVAVMLGTFSVMQRAVSALDSARNLEVAGNIMQCEIEKERLMSWAQVSDASYAPSIDGGFTRIPSVAGRFSLSRSIQTVANRGSQMLQITLTVSWRNADNRILSRSYTTYYLENGLHDFLYSQN